MVRGCLQSGAWAAVCLLTQGAPLGAQPPQPAAPIRHVELVRAGDQSYGIFTHVIDELKQGVAVEVTVRTHDPAALLATLATDPRIRVAWKPAGAPAGGLEFGGLTIGETISRGRGQSAKLSVRIGEVLHQTEGVLFGQSADFVQLLRVDNNTPRIEQYRFAQVESVQLDPKTAAAANLTAEALRKEPAAEHALSVVSSEDLKSASLRYVLPVAAWSVSYELRNETLAGIGWRISGRTVLENTSAADWKDATVVLHQESLAYSVSGVNLERGDRLGVAVFAPFQVTVTNQFEVGLTAKADNIKAKRAVRIVNDQPGGIHLLRGPVVVRDGGPRSYRSELKTDLYATAPSSKPAANSVAVVEGGTLEDLVVKATPLVAPAATKPVVRDGRLQFTEQRVFSIDTVNTGGHQGLLRLIPPDKDFKPDEVVPIDAAATGLSFKQSRTVERDLFEIPLPYLEALAGFDARLTGIVNLRKDLIDIEKQLQASQDSLLALKLQGQGVRNAPLVPAVRSLIDRVANAESDVRALTNEAAIKRHQIAVAVSNVQVAAP